MLHGCGYSKRFANFISAFFVKKDFEFSQWYMGVVLVKGLPILSMVSLLTGVPKFINGYMDETLVKGVANLMNGFFVKRCV